MGGGGVVDYSENRLSKPLARMGFAGPARRRRRGPRCCGRSPR